MLCRPILMSSCNDNLNRGFSNAPEPYLAGGNDDKIILILSFLIYFKK